MGDKMCPNLHVTESIFLFFRISYFSIDSFIYSISIQGLHIWIKLRWILKNKKKIHNNGLVNKFSSEKKRQNIQCWIWTHWLLEVFFFFNDFFILSSAVLLSDMHHFNMSPMYLKTMLRPSMRSQLATGFRIIFSPHKPPSLQESLAPEDK